MYFYILDALYSRFVPSIYNADIQCIIIYPTIERLFKNEGILFVCEEKMKICDIIKKSNIIINPLLTLQS